MAIETEYNAALGLLYDRINYERTSHLSYTAQNYRLDRMRVLLEQLGNPQKKYSIIHIAGTKGKGSTSHLIYEAIRACGWRAGLYTSPHLLKLEERFQFNGQLCSPRQFVELVNQVLEVSEKIAKNGWGTPTFFELTTAIGFTHFANQRADLVVLEVGMGGRLDSTNVCDPLLTMITSISLDHQAQLGSTIPEIAREKAGIIKPGIPVISLATDPQALAVIQQRALEQTACLMQLGQHFSVTRKTYRLEESAGIHDRRFADVQYHWHQESLPFTLGDQPWQLSMLGKHQADNLAGVITSLNWLNSQTDWTIDPQRSREAIATTQVPGRLQIVGDRPLRVIDTAHNPASVQAGWQALEEQFGEIPKVVVFASSKDKDYRTMLRHILPGCKHLICTAFEKNPRAVSPDELAKTAGSVQLQMSEQGDIAQHSVQIHQVAGPVQAWRAALSICPVHGLIVAVGSFFLAAELLEFFQSERHDG